MPRKVVDVNMDTIELVTVPARCKCGVEHTAQISKRQQAVFEGLNRPLIAPCNACYAVLDAWGFYKEESED